MLGVNFQPAVAGIDDIDLYSRLNIAKGLRILVGRGVNPARPGNLKGSRYTRLGFCRLSRSWNCFGPFIDSRLG